MRREQVPARLAERDCPDFGEPAWTPAPPPGDRQVAIVSTAGLIQRGDRPFGFGAADYRIIDAESPADLMMSHISTNFDRTGFYRDLNVVFPIDRLRELRDEGVIGSIASRHFSFMGATPPHLMEPLARDLAGILQQDGVNGIVFCPV